MAVRGSGRARAMRATHLTAVAAALVLVAASTACAKPEPVVSPDLLISSVVMSKEESISSVAIELYNPSCRGVHTRKEGMELALRYCESGSRKGYCVTRRSTIHGYLPKLKTLVICSSDNPSVVGGVANNTVAEGLSKCDTNVGASLAPSGAARRLVEVKLVDSNGTHVLDRVHDREAFSSEAFTLKKYSEFSDEDIPTEFGDDQPKSSASDASVREISSIWLFKPYATQALLGCHNTKHEMLCEDALPEVCPPADIDSFRTLTVNEIVGSAPCAVDAGCVSSFHGETISTLGYVVSKMGWFSENKNLWMITLKEGEGITAVGTVKSLRVLVDIPSGQDNEMKVAWMDALPVGSKISLVGRLSKDEYGVVVKGLLKMDFLDHTPSADKILPVVSLDRHAHKTVSEEGEATLVTTAREALDTFAIVAIAMCSTFLVVGSGILILANYRKHVNPSRAYGKLNGTLL